MIKLTDEEKETLSYSDAAYLILNETKKKYKIQDLFKEVIKLFEQTDDDFEDNIGNFFELIITDKRFIMLDDGYCDLKINHSAKVIVEDDDDYEVMPDDTDFEETLEDSYDDEDSANDDADDDLQGLVIIDDSEELDDSDMM